MSNLIHLLRHKAIIVLTCLIFISGINALDIGEAPVDPKLCPESCHGNGDCYHLYQKVLYQGEDQLIDVFVCSCYKNFVGELCSACRFGYYGPDCQECPAMTESGDPCGGHGVCDDDKEGSGECRCVEGYDEGSHCSELKDYAVSSVNFNIGVTLLLVGAIGCMLLEYCFLRYPALKLLPASLSAILLGLALGAVVHFESPESDISSVLSFKEEFFFLILLPPILFNAGFSINKTHFFKQFGTILLFALVGTAISAIIFGMLMWLLGAMNVITAVPIYESLMFGSLISAVDPVATLAIFNALGVEENIFMLVFGESSLNDAVSITLYRSFTVLATTDGGITSWGVVGGFFLIFMGSIALSFVLGAVTAYIFRKLDLSEYPNLEFALCLFFSYLPFVLLEALGLSGILGIVFVGMMMGHYTLNNLSPQTKQTITQSFEMAAMVAEMFCFVYLGISLPLQKKDFHLSYILCGFLMLLVSRAFAVFPLSALCNWNRKSSERIPRSHQLIMWFSGLRGAVSFALSQSFLPEYRDLIMTTTLVLVLSTVVILGGGAAPFLRLFAAGKKKKATLSRYNTGSSDQIGVMSNKFPLMFSPAALKKHGVNKFLSLDKNYLQKWLCRPESRTIEGSIETEMSSQDANGPQQKKEAEDRYARMEDETFERERVTQFQVDKDDDLIKQVMEMSKESQNTHPTVVVEESKEYEVTDEKKEQSELRTEF